MGKLQKQRANILKKQILKNTKNEDFQNMIKSMKEDEYYRVKKNNGFLFEGKSLPGVFWKKMFLLPETDENKIIK